MTENEILAAANRGGQQAALVALLLYFVLSLVARLFRSLFHYVNPLNWLSAVLPKARTGPTSTPRSDSSEQSVVEPVQDYEEPPVLRSRDGDQSGGRGSW